MLEYRLDHMKNSCKLDKQRINITFKRVKKNQKGKKKRKKNLQYQSLKLLELRNMITCLEKITLQKRKA